MSEVTIEIPAEHVEAIRRSLVERRSDAECEEGLEGLLSQLASEAVEGPQSCALTGPRTVLWRAIYDALCSAAEQLADDCNEYWRGGIGPESVRTAIAAVGARLELLVALGAPPGR